MTARATPARDDTLEVEGLSVFYGGVVAVDSVSFGVPRGSILGVIGPNGAGKTTIFDAICGFAPIERGRVILDGEEITELSPTDKSRMGLGRSFQDARLFPSLTVHETLACALERHMSRQDPVSTALAMPWIRRSERRVADRVEELVELMGLGAFSDKFISELSTGSRRVVDLACTLAHEPSVLLLDEPSSGMAQKETEAMGPLLHRVKGATGCTMLLIEHDMPLITSVSDELIALETGQIIARGAPHEVTNDPRVVEAYLGTDQRFIARSGAAADGKRPARKKKKTKPRSGTSKPKAVKPKARKAKGASTRKSSTSRRKPSAAKRKSSTSRRKPAAARRKPAAKKPSTRRKPGPQKPRS